MYALGQNSDIAHEIKDLFEVTMADRELAHQVINAIHALRQKRVKVGTAATGLVAYASFDQVSLGTIEHLLDLGKTPEELTESLSWPVEWKCLDCKGRTPQEAIDRARAHRDTGRNQMQKDGLDAAEAGLPALVGTEKQVAWARSIRAEHLKKRPESQHKMQANAAWWIDHRSTI